MEMPQKRLCYLEIACGNLQTGLVIYAPKYESAVS